MISLVVHLRALDGTQSFVVLVPKQKVFKHYFSHCTPLGNVYLGLLTSTERESDFFMKQFQ